MLSSLWVAILNVIYLKKRLRSRACYDVSVSICAYFNHAQITSLHDVICVSVIECTNNQAIEKIELKLFFYKRKIELFYFSKKTGGKFEHNFYLPWLNTQCWGWPMAICYGMIQNSDDAIRKVALQSYL